jgi:biotin-(acetyl-CoA carboxylase) ligase
MFLERGGEAIVDAFSKNSSWASGRRVVVEGAGAPLEGVTAGLDRNGVLRVRTAEGVVVPVIAGSVRSAADQDTEERSCFSPST